jgi:ABC-2 type transport system permease protein
MGVIVRDTAATIATVLALLYGAPMVAMFLSNARWQDRIHRFARWTRAWPSSPLGISRPHRSARAGLGVLSVYAAGAVLIGALVFRLRDA